MTEKPRARTYAVLSGKGGVGKTIITANLAASLASSGRRVLVLDADLGLANLDVILGLNPTGTIQDVLAGRIPLDRAIIPTRSGFDLLPAGSATPEMSPLTPSLSNGLTGLIEQIIPLYDEILFDAGAGIGDVVLFFARVADEIILVVTPEPTSMMDAYATIKVLALRHSCTDIRLVVNQADPKGPELSGMRVASHLQSVVTRFLSAECGSPVRLHFAGSLPSDPAVARAIRRQQLLAETDPFSPAAMGIPRLAAGLQNAL